MLGNLRNKLRKAFGLKAKPPAPEVPKEIAENRHIQKAVIKNHRRKIRRRLRNVFLASAALSTALQFTPDLVSTKFDDFMAQKGYPADYAQHFHTGDIRVYDRYNPLYPFHLAGRAVGIVWNESLKEQHTSYIALMVGTPFIYVSGLWQGFTEMIPFGSKLDAYSLTTNDAPRDRVNFIRPPGTFSLNGFLSDFTGVDGRALEFKSDRAELREVLFQFVMLHEARHGDQDHLAYVTANESDADMYAFRVLAARGVDKALLNEAASIVVHARAINATLGGDAGHVSTFAMQRGHQRIFDAYQDAAAFQRLHEVLAEADRRNDAVLPPEMRAGNRYLYLTLAMQREGLLDEDPGMKRAASVFLNAIGYFDRLSGGMIIDRGFDFEKIDLGYLTERYTPVPDKLHPPSPQAPRPNS